jgi:hypothetical protein
MRWMRCDPETEEYYVFREQSFRCECGAEFSPDLLFVEGTRVPTDIPVHCPECFALVGVLNTSDAGERCPGCKMPIAPPRPPPIAPARRAPLAALRAWIGARSPR